MAAKDTVTRILITAKDEASGVFSSLQAHAGKIATAIAAAFGFKLFGDSVKAANELDVQMRKLEATVAATGGAAGLTAEEIDAMARRLDEATLGSAAGFRDAAAQLLTFKSVGKDSFETTLKLAQDLAQAGFGTLESNVVQLGKSLEDPVKGLTALTRSGVTFSAEQQALIKSLVETGQAAKAQGLILEAVAGQVGGVAEAAGGGLAGALDLVGKRFTDIKEQLGAAVLPVFQQFNQRLADLYGRLAESGVIKTFGETIATVFDRAQEAFFRFFDSFDLDALIAKMQGWATATQETVTQWAGYLTTASDVAKVAFGAISTGIETLKAAFFGVSSVVASFVESLLNGYAAIQDGLAKITFGDVSARFTASANEIRAAADSFGHSAQVNADKARAALDSATESGRGLRSAFGDLVGTADTAGKAVERVADKTFVLQKHAHLTADQLDAMGEGFEYVDGASRSAAGGIHASAAAADTAGADLLAAERAALALEQAYKDLGITSQKSLQEAADRARQSFETIRASGTAAPREIQAAFSAYAERAIAANGGVATATLEAEAQMLGLKIEANDTGKVIVSSMLTAAEATGAVGGAADKSAASVRRLRGELQDMQKEQQKGPGGGGDDAGGSGGYTDIPGLGQLRSFYDRAEQLGGEALRKQMEGVYKEHTRVFNGLPISWETYFKTMSKVFVDMENQLDAFEKKQRDSAQTTAAAAATTTAPVRGGQSAPTPFGSAAGTQTTRHEVAITLPRGRTTTVQTATAQDAAALTGILQQLEADMMRAS